MATLTEVSVIARRIIKWGAVALVVIALIPGAITLIKAAYKKLNPPPPPAPTVRYGKLPKLVFPDQTGSTLPEFKLETIQGGLPALQNTSRVYVVGINKSRLRELDRIKQRARVLGLTIEPVELNETNYRFLHPSLPAELNYDLVTGGFSYKYDWTRDTEISTAHGISQGNQAIGEARNILGGLATLPADLAQGPAKTVYLVATDSAMVPTEVVFEANFVRVDLFRAERDKLVVVTDGGTTSPVNVILSGVTGNRRVVQINYQYSQILDGDFATYPLKTVSQAWNELTSGSGFIARAVGPKVVVRKAYLAYYEPSSPQQFFQPVFVFEGDGGFLGYVPAIDPKYVQ